METPQTRNRFRRRPRHPVKKWFVVSVLLVIALSIVMRGAHSEPALAIASGEYQLQGIHEDASLTIATVGDEATSLHKRTFDVGWLGIEILSADAAARWLSAQLPPGQLLEIRFDRRRLDAEGNLVAYLYLGEELLNESLIRHGFAIEATHPSDHAPIARRLRQARRE